MIYINHMSKGSTPRPFTDKDIFDENFDRIFRNEQKAFKDLEKSIKKHGNLPQIFLSKNKILITHHYYNLRTYFLG